MPLEISALQRRVLRLRSFASFLLVAMAQYLSPAAAADPASKIDPPAWSHRHSQQEIQAYRARSQAQEPDKKAAQKFSQAKLRRLLRQSASQG